MKALIRTLCALLSAGLIAGATHSAPNPPSRVVSLSPVATEFIFALGLGDKVVGVTTYCDRPTQAKNITKIGGFVDPQLEAIIQLRPDLVVATPFGNAKNVVASLEARSVHVLARPVESLEDMKRFLRALGQVTLRSEKAKALEAEFDSKFAKLHNRLAVTKPKILLLVSSSPLIAAGPSTFPGEIIQHLGAQNAVKTGNTAWPVLSLEILLKDPPQIVVVTNGSKALEAARNQLKPLLLKFPKIKLFAPSRTLIQRPGPYLIEEIQELLNGLQAQNA